MKLKQFANSFCKQFVLLFLLLNGIGMSESWGQTSLGSVTITSDPTSTDGWNLIQYDGFLRAWCYKPTSEGVATVDEKKYVKLQGDGYFKLRVTKGTLYAGDILKVDASRYYNDSGTELGFYIQGSGTTTTTTISSSSRTGTIEYTLKPADIQNDPDDTSYDMIVIKRAANSDGTGSGYAYHSFEAIRPSGYVVTWDTSVDNHDGDAWYTVGTDATKYRCTQSGIASGTTIHYQSTEGETWVVNGWYKNGVETSTFFKYQENYDHTITEDTYILPEWQNTHSYVAATNGGGTAIVYASSDGNKTNISGKKFKSWETKDVYYLATANNGFEFVSWEDGVTTNPREVTDHNAGTVYTHTATFKSSKYQTGIISATINSRNYQVYVPTNLTSSTNVPLIFTLHGRSCDYTLTGGGVPDFQSIADNNNVIVVSPEGTNQCWNAYTDKSNSDKMNEYNNDYTFLKSIIDNLSSTSSSNPTYNNGNCVTIDKTKIYAVGFSNGGMMAYALVTNHPDVFAAGGAVSGIPVNQYALHKSSGHPVPFIHFQGKSDAYVRYEQSAQHIANWTSYNGCGSATTTGDIDVSASSDYHASYAAGTGNVPFEFYGINGAGHTPNMTYNGTSSSSIIWDFIKNYSLGSTAVDMTVVWCPNLSDLNSSSNASKAWGSETDNYVKTNNETAEGNLGVCERICFEKGKHQIRFTANGTVKIKVYKRSSTTNLVYKKNTVTGSETVFDFDVTENGDYVVEITRDASTQFSAFGIYKVDLPVESTILDNSTTPTVNEGVYAYSGVASGNSAFRYLNVNMSNYSSITTNLTYTGTWNLHYNNNVTTTAVSASEQTFSNAGTNGSIYIQGGSTLTIGYIRLNYKNTSVSTGADATSDDPIGGQRIKAGLSNIGTGDLGETGSWSGGKLVTANTSYNHADIFRFSDYVDNANVSGKASNYTGIRFHANGTAFRVLIYINGATSPRILTLDSGEKDYAYTWSELGITSADDIAKIERICFAGQQNGSTNVTFSNVWIEKIDDICHTFVTYDDDIKKWSSENSTYTYSLTTPEGDATAVFSGISGTSRKSVTNEIKLEYSLTITAPTGRVIKAVKIITDATASDLNFLADSETKQQHAAYSTDVTNGYQVVWTCEASKVTVSKASSSTLSGIYVAKIEVIFDTDDVLHPALSKIADGRYTVDLDKVRSYGNYAYDVEDHTAYASNITAYGGNFDVRFETAQDFSNLTKMIVDYSGTNIVSFIDFWDDSKSVLTKYGVDLSGVTFSDEDRSKLTSVKQINFASQNPSTGAMVINSIELDISHIKPTVALDNGINTSYTIGLGQTLTLSGHATACEAGPNGVLWEQYASANATEPMSNPTFKVKYQPSISFVPSVEGTYYLGIRAYEKCPTSGDSDNTTGSDSHYVFSSPTIVTVTVQKNNIYEDVELTFDGNTYDEASDGTVDLRHYKVYVPQSVINGAAADKANVPVLFSLHGTNQTNDPTAGGVQNYNALAEANKFVVVYPQGRKLQFNGYSGNSNPIYGWEATGAANEDTKFFEAIINDLSSNSIYKDGDNPKFTINQNKIYMTGNGNGGMMAYATANVLADKFAAFSSVNGLPMNEMHMRHHGVRPVPFIHIHGTKNDFVKYSLMPSIRDNMIFRNGCDITPTTKNGEAVLPDATSTRYTKSTYSGGEQPYEYYEVGTGMTSTDTGMGRNDISCTLDGTSSLQVIWDFLNNYTLPSPASSNLEFCAKINTNGDVNNEVARNHGWATNSGSLILAQYGTSGGYTTAGENVYHSLQLNAGDHYLSFNTTGETTNYVVIRLTKLGDLSNFDELNTTHTGFTTTSKNIIDDVAYYVQENGTICLKFNIEKGDAGEYMLTINKGSRFDNTKLSNIQISKSGTEAGNKYSDHINVDFTGYFNYVNRLFAQWNFDQCDGYRFKGEKVSSSYWSTDYSNTDTGSSAATNGTIIYTYTQALGSQDLGTDYTSESNYLQLSYDGDGTSAGTAIIPVAAGLKFNAPANSVKIYVDLSNGVVTGTHLVIDENVKLLVPYVENSYRNDKSSTVAGEDNLNDFSNCMHHIKRDIVYFALNQGNFWSHIKNEPIDLPGQQLFHNGGDEYQNGANYQKGDYLGNEDTPCIVRFNSETVIDRIGVNRNLTYSFYTEYIKDLGYQKPYPGMRIVGNPSGAKVADAGSTYTTYSNAVAMTYGGWALDPYSPYNAAASPDNNTNAITDSWSELGVFNGQSTSDSSTDVWMNYSDATNATESNVRSAIDGFPVVSKTFYPAKSESLMPSTTTGNYYHPANEGNLKTTSYTPNITPWSLPCRGAYGKYEVSYPGVLNADVVMIGGEKYYICDEFGKPITQAVFSRTASGSTNVVTKTTEASETYYTVPKTDYVKFSFNAYPGKTYYIFSNDAGMGITGFYFEPFVYRYDSESDVPEGKSFEFARMDVGVSEIELKDTETYSLPENGIDGNAITRDVVITSPDGEDGVDYTIKYSKNAVKVKLDRSFKANTWNSICVPYSINKAQMEQVFGEGTEVILLRDIQKRNTSAGYDKTTMNFITHINQDIIAGYPYFIKPTQDVSSVETYATFPESDGKPELMNSITSQGSNTGDGTALGGMKGYTFIGTYDNGEKMKTYSYYLNGSGQLCLANKDYTMKGYRAWMEYDGTSTEANQSKIRQALVNDDEEIEIAEATGIDDVEMDATYANGISVNDNNVYNVNGQLVRSNTTDLTGLAKGIYIVGGKKFIVK